ncbi:MAG: PAS domain S-box protein [Cocleimonas sp.]
MQKPDKPIKNTELDTRKDRELGFSSVLEDSLNEIYIFDATSLAFIKVNNGAQQNLGYSMDELLTMTPFDIKPNHTEASFREVIKPLIDGKKQKIEFNTVHQRKDGSDYLVEVHLQKMHFHGRQVFVAIILDVTERTQNKLDLVQAHAFLDSAPDATVVVDESGGIRVSNQQMTELLGYSQEELLGMNVDALLPKRYRDAHPKHRVDFANNPVRRGMGTGMDLCAMTKNGREIPIEVSLSPIKTVDGSLVAAAIRDISSRKAFEEELRLAKQEAEDATVAKTRFLATASHDLRQPLQALRLYLSALTSKLDEPKAKQLGAKMNLSLDTMGELLDALLDISTLESGSVKVEKSNVKISEVLGRIIANNSQQAKEKGLEFECEGLDYIVYTDPTLLQRIIDNFITNAIRYTQKGKISLKGQITDNMLNIIVTDTGVGIPENDLESIFDEFVQLDNSVRSSNSGLGLGLSIVKHIARLLEHPTSVNSVNGKGSSFSVEVPLSDSQTVAEEQQAVIQETADLNHELTVLIVDDEPAIVDAMYELLSIYDMKVITAGHAAEALAHIQEGLEPDFILTDYRMPEMNGVELVRKIRGAINQNIPVVIMTGDTTKEKINDANLDNCTVLQKPVKIDQLLSLIRTVKS